MKKILIIFIFVVFISGCEMNYEIFYKSPESIIETIEVGVNNSIIYQFDDNLEDYFYNVYNSYKTSYNLEKYKISMKQRTVNSYMNLVKEHSNLNELFENEAMNMFFLDRSVTENENKIIVKLSDYNYYYEGAVDIELGELYITLKSNYKVKTNAISSNNLLGIYKWKITPTNSNQTLEIEFSDDINIVAYIYNLFPWVLWLILFLVLIVLLFVIYKVIGKRLNKVNKI